MPHRNEIIQVFAPLGLDARHIASLLENEGLNPNVVGKLSELTAHIADTTGAIIITEEGAFQQDWSRLTQALADQPSWSAIPFIFIISSRRGRLTPSALQAQLPPEASNVMVLERPMGSVSLVSAAKWALAARRRQFQTRDHLQELQDRSAQQRLLTRELAHRVKNTIAVLQSVVTQTLRNQTDIHIAEDLLMQRFAALGRAHDLLLSTDFQRSEFGELVRTSLATQVIESNRLQVNGPALDISPQAALSFALVFHELATNASKYGALSVPGGRIRVDWQVMDTSEEPQFRMVWEETGGPPVNPPRQSGFGSKLIRASLAALGKVDLDYRPTGLHVGLNASLERLTHSVVPG